MGWGEDQNQKMTLNPSPPPPPRPSPSQLLTVYPGLLIGNQAMDFLKQDGVTEVSVKWAQ